MKHDYAFLDSITSIKELPGIQRPRERLQDCGPGSLSDMELMCILIGSGTKENPVQVLAEKVLRWMDENSGKSTLNVGELLGVEGIGMAQASKICAALELGKRLNFSSRKPVRSAEDVFPLIRHFGDRKQEHFLTVLLNGAHEVTDVKVVTVGLLNRTLVHPREIFADAVKKRACAVILAHNHPSGNLVPTTEDIEVTKGLVKAGSVLGIRVLDHILFSSEGFLSLLDNGKMRFG